MDEKCAEALKREFGVVPDEDGGWKWVVYQDQALICVHPEHRMRVYRRCAMDDQDYHEIEPIW